MKKRNLSGAYFRFQQPDGSWDNVTFEDLPEEAQDKYLEGRSEEWLKNMVKLMAKTLVTISDQFDIYCE